MKPFIPLDKQVEKLINRGLKIESIHQAEKQLIKTSYYDLINGYKDMFLVEKSNPDEEDKFIEGTTFKDLVKLFNLDREIRHIVMRATLDVECNFYTAIAYSIAEEYGEKHEEYLKKENYKRGKKQSKKYFERDNFLFRVNNKIQDPNDNPMKHYMRKYGNIPPWILVKHLSFGELIVWYKISQSDIKNNIVRNFTGAEPTDESKEFFLKSMELCNKFRNKAAHSGRIYNYKTNIELPYRESLHKVFLIDKTQYGKGIGRSDLTALFLCMLQLYENDYHLFLEQVAYLNFALEEYKKFAPLYHTDVLKQIGLPPGYYKMMSAKILATR